MICEYQAGESSAVARVGTLIRPPFSGPPGTGPCHSHSPQGLDALATLIEDPVMLAKAIDSTHETCLDEMTLKLEETRGPARKVVGMFDPPKSSNPEVPSQ